MIHDCLKKTCQARSTVYIISSEKYVGWGIRMDVYYNIIPRYFKATNQG